MRKNTIFRYLPPCSTHLLQPADQFIIPKIKDAWIRMWDDKRAQMTRNGEWQNECVGRQRGWSGKLHNPGNTFYLSLAAHAVREVNNEVDPNGLTYTRKAMIRCGLSLDVYGIWRIQQLLPDLQAIIDTFNTFKENRFQKMVINVKRLKNS